MTKSQNERDGWQKLKQELEGAAATGKVDDVKVRILYKPDTAQTPAAVEITYRMNGQHFVHTFCTTADEAGSLLGNYTNIGIDNIALAIRELMAQGLPEEWVVARAVATMDSVKNGLTHGQYKRDSGEETWYSFDTDYRLYIAFAALRQQLHNLLGESCATTQATLLPNGSLVFAFVYNTAGDVSAR